MVLWTFLICATIGCVFTFVVFYGAPFLPTRRSRVEEAIELLGLKPGQTLLELGSGDGRLLQAAARHGVRGIGYELNPLLVIYSRLLTWKYRKFVDIRLANYWNVPLPACDAVYVFLLNPYMPKLAAKLTSELQKPTKVVSFVFPFPDSRPVEELDGLLVYEFVPDMLPIRDV